MLVALSAVMELRDKDSVAAQYIKTTCRRRPNLNSQISGIPYTLDFLNPQIWVVPYPLPFPSQAITPIINPLHSDAN